ncbi:phage tail length tape measure family protein [Candidatus Pacearchaeota archaeon]|nr:phage tail length tape measure family protein [Candidatus Pacearchaeota archaeon]
MSAVDLGSLQLTVEANTRSLDKALPNIEKLEKAVNKMASSFDKMGAKTNKANRSTAKSFNKTSNAAQRMQTKMQGVSTSATLMLGPLNGVAARMTALTGLFNKNTLALASMFAGMVAFTAGTVKALKAGAEYQKTLAQWEGQLHITGRAVGYTTKQLDDMSVAIAINTLQSVEGSRKATTALLGFATITGKNFERTLKLASDMSAVFGDDLTMTAKKLGKALAHPGESLDSLNRAGIDFTKTEIKILKQMNETGRAAQAQSYILSKLEGSFKEVGAAAATGTLSGAWDTLGERATLFFEKLLHGQGALSGITNLINTLADTIDSFTKSIDNGSFAASSYATIINTIANAFALLIKNIVPVTGALLSLSLINPLSKLLIALPIGFAGVIKLQKALYFLRPAMLAAFTGIGIGTYLSKNFKEVRVFAFSVIGVFDRLLIRFKMYGAMITRIITYPFKIAYDKILDISANFINNLANTIPDGYLAKKLGIGPEVADGMRDLASSMLSSKSGVKSLVADLKGLSNWADIEIAKSHKLVAGYTEWENSIEGVGKAASKTTTMLETLPPLAIDLKALKGAGKFMLGQVTDIVNQMQSMYEAQAAMYGKIAQDALDSGRSTAQFYMELADAVHYSNNQQAKSFEDKAKAAAAGAAAEYAANKKLQDQANAAAKKNFENQKMLQKAQIMISTGTAVMKAYEMAGPLGHGMAAAMAALGAVQLSMVSKQQYSPRQYGGDVVPGQAYMVGEVGSEMFVPNTPGTIIPNNELNNMGGGGGGDIHVTFQITANDSRGFDQLLQERKGQIINMIQQAQQERMSNSF